MVGRIVEIARKFFGELSDELPGAPAQQALSSAIAPVHRKVLMVVHNPPIASRGGKRLTEIFGWHDPAESATGYINDLRSSSGGYLNYDIVERIDADWYPVMKDGFAYDDETYLRDWEARTPHEPNAIDYEEQ